MSDLMPCPFCGGELLAWGASAFMHPRGKCILSHRLFKKGFIGQWNTRTVQALIDAAVLAERERWITSLAPIRHQAASTRGEQAYRELPSFVVNVLTTLIRKGDQP